MPFTKRIFTVGDDESTKHYASKLGKAFYPDSKLEVADIASDECFTGVEADNLRSMIFLGHGCTHDYGGYTPKEFAKRMAKLFRKDQMAMLQHLYLVGCDAGLIKDDGQTLAQEIADELANIGFTNVQVHTIAKPENASGEALYVEVIDRPGLSSIQGVQEGYINAFLLNAEDAKRFDELSKDKKKHWREIADIKDKKAFRFVRGVNPAVELEKPHNIFIPHEDPVTRMKRIDSHPYTKLSREQEHAVDLLRQRREHELKKHDQRLVRKLDFIITQLVRAQPQDWQVLVRDFIPYLAISILGITLNDRSNTLKLLKKLAKGDFEKARKIIEKQHEKDKHEHKGKIEIHPVKAIKSLEDRLERKVKDLVHKKTGEDLESDEERKTDEHKPLLASEEKKSSDGKEFNKEGSLETEHTTHYPYSDQPTLREMIQHTRAVSAIKKLIATLQSEIDDLCEGCFSFFYRYEINTKIAKRDALDKLKDLKTFRAIQLRAAEILLHPEDRVMRQARTARTRNLLDMLVNHPERLNNEENQELAAPSPNK
jgi:hypothetical protein